MTWLVAWLLMGVVVAASGCEPNDAEHGVVGARQAVVYGADDRVEPYQAADERLTQIALASTAAVVLRTAISIDEHGEVRVDAPSAEEAFGLCPGERFASQPSGALCSAVLVAPDIVLTAGHCLARMSCPRLSIVFGYHYSAPELANVLHRDDVYDCAAVLALDVSDREAEEFADFAFLLLARPVAGPYRPVVVQTDVQRTRVGGSVSVVGHSAGLPTKVAEHGSVTDAREHQRDYFLASIDNFVGGSGSGVFDEDANLVGVAVRGESDFVVDETACQRIARLAEEAPGAGASGEKVGYASAALQQLCAEASSADLCPGQPEPPRAASCAVTRGVMQGNGRAAAMLLALLMLCLPHVGRRRR